jgi:hypothetical protein
MGWHRVGRCHRLGSFVERVFIGRFPHIKERENEEDFDRWGIGMLDGRGGSAIGSK